MQTLDLLQEGQEQAEKLVSEQVTNNVKKLRQLHGNTQSLLNASINDLLWKKGDPISTEFSMQRNQSSTKVFLSLKLKYEGDTFGGGFTLYRLDHQKELQRTIAQGLWEGVDATALHQLIIAKLGLLIDYEDGVANWLETPKDPILSMTAEERVISAEEHRENAAKLRVLLSKVQSNDIKYDYEHENGSLVINQREEQHQIGNVVSQLTNALRKLLKKIF